MGVFMLFEIENLNIAFGNRVVLKDFGLAVGKTDRILLLGENGSGKSTLLRHICKEFNKVCKISYLRQQDMLLPYCTVLENLELVGGEERAEQLLKELNLEKYKTHYPYQLSGGTHRSVLVLRALLFPFELLVLDEPLANIDSKAVSRICKLIENETEGRALIFSAHQRAKELKFADKTVIL